MACSLGNLLLANLLFHMFLYPIIRSFKNVVSIKPMYVVGSGGATISFASYALNLLLYYSLLILFIPTVGLSEADHIDLYLMSTHKMTWL